jgi:agmatine/peptidylarginine deiminase
LKNIALNHDTTGRSVLAEYTPIFASNEKGEGIVSEYPPDSQQEDSIQPALHVLEEHGHTVHRVPGLDPIVYDDINTMPNYANGVIVNQAALAPACNREEDEIVSGILRDYGYEVFPIDCSNVILTNCGIHCISKTVPALS